MKTFKFNNGETRLESQIGEGKDFRTACVFWGCSDIKTGKPLPYTVHKTTEKEIKEEQDRLEENKQKFQDICEKNERINIGNENVANATNINEFLNAYL